MEFEFERQLIPGVVLIGVDTVVVTAGRKIHTNDNTTFVNNFDH